VEKRNRYFFSEDFAASFGPVSPATWTFTFSIFCMHPINHTESRKNRGAVENRNPPFFTPDFIEDYEDRKISAFSRKGSPSSNVSNIRPKLRIDSFALRMPILRVTEILRK
jgi:hypothetical protein